MSQHHLHLLGLDDVDEGGEGGGEEADGQAGPDQAEKRSPRTTE